MIAVGVSLSSVLHGKTNFPIRKCKDDEKEDVVYSVDRIGIHWLVYRTSVTQCCQNTLLIVRRQLPIGWTRVQSIAVLVG